MLHILNTTKHTIPFSEKLLSNISDEILGFSYDLSIVIVGEKKARSLNQTYRNKDYIPNVLSFPIDETMGEIFINPKQLHIEAPKYNLTSMQYAYYLTIHSMLHLKGFDHGDEMTSLEKKYMKKFFNLEINI